jgi:putative flippase GtrA
VTLGEPTTLLRFAVVGAINTGVGLATVVVAMRLFGLNAFVANGFGFVAGFVVGYSLNRAWTFNSDASVATTGSRYVFAFLVSYVVNLGILSILLAATIVDPIMAQAAALIGYSLVFYVLCRTIVFPANR